MYLGYRHAVVNGKKHVAKMRRSPQLSRRYQALLAKELRKAGLPALWVKSRRHLSFKHTKPTKRFEKTERNVEKFEQIRKMLKDADQEILNYRQEALNNRKSTGVPALMEAVLSSWLNDAKVMQHQEGNRVQAGAEPEKEQDEDHAASVTKKISRLMKLQKEKGGKN